MASPTPNTGMTYPVRGGAVGVWDTPLDTNFDTIDAVLGGTVVVPAAGTGATLTQTQANNRRISITGVLAQNYLMSFPAIGGLWVVANNTTGSFTVTLNVIGSIAIAITVNQGDSALVNSNGTDLFVSLAGGTWNGATFAGSDLAPASFSTDQNDYSPPSLNLATCLRLNATAACSLTGIAGGAAGRDLELINIGTATIKVPANSISSAAANRFANTFNLFPGQSIFLRYDAASLLWRPKNVATAFSSCAIAAVGPDLLIVNHTGTENTRLDITMTEAVLVDASGNAIKFENIAVSIDSTTTGPGGCDTGTRAANTSYFEWLASDGVNINGVLSTSAAAATVLTNLTNSGFGNYIYLKRIGGQFTNASSNFQRIIQKYRRAQYVVSSAITTALPNIANGVQGTYSATAPVWATPSLAGLVPSTASRVQVAVTFKWNNAAAANVAVAANGLYGGVSSINPPLYCNSNPTIGPLGGAMVDLTLEGPTFAWVSDGVGGAISCIGWDDSI